MYDQLFISQLQRFSIHDGPGIRLTVFLKGCNLRCAWCHNPETQKNKPELQYLEARCRFCADCVKTCAHGARSIENGKMVFRQERCILCGTCADQCFADALIIAGRWMGIEQIIKTAKKDADIYDHYGGITFSGGEPLLAGEALVNALKLAKDNHLHTAVDTAGNVPWEMLEEILPYTDLFLYDVKAVRNSIHRKYTGVDNQRILDNLIFLTRKKTKVWIRIPLIHKVNDQREDIAAFEEYYEKLGRVEHVDLLPYHAYGTYKARSLQMEEKTFETPQGEYLRLIEERLQKKGIPARIY